MKLQKFALTFCKDSQKFNIFMQKRQTENGNLQRVYGNDRMNRRKQVHFMQQEEQI